MLCGLIPLFYDLSLSLIHKMIKLDPQNEIFFRFIRMINKEFIRVIKVTPNPKVTLMALCSNTWYQTKKDCFKKFFF